MDFNIRKASKNDLPEVLNLVKELAIYENAPEEVSIKLKDLEKDGFGDNPLFWIILAENSKGIIGMSFYFIRYSTWKGKCLYLEDLVVKEEYRGKKIGEALFEATIKTAKEINAKQMNWQVLDWNEPAINFYKKFDAELDEEWINGKIRL
jgi:GNAT superfamily N-acetyltransferase|tara:strand:+ start:294 stop:743 length:450 start_codon:yes stop_codon:yes gene_type:complete